MLKRGSRGCVTLCLSLAVGMTWRVQALELYVARTGNDANPGTRSKPFATWERARDEIRKRKQNGRVRERFTIFVRGGIYRFTQTLELNEADSGSERYPIAWQAAPGEEVRCIGGARLTGFKPVSDPAILARIAPSARGKVLQVDLKTAGVVEMGKVAATDGTRADLICGHKYMTMARYPNAGDWLRIVSIPEGGTRNEYEKVVHYGRFTYDGARPSHWQDLKDVWVHGYWVYDWSDQYHHVQKLDLDKKEVWPEPPYHVYGYKAGQRFYFLNVLEELDQPGEWYLDRAAGILYFWPPAGEAEVLFPELQKPVLVLDTVGYVSIRRMTFECSRAGAIVVKGGTHDEIAGCLVRNVGGTGIEVQGGTHHRIQSCDVCEVAATAISVEGGDRKTLSPGGHVVENCDLHHYARIQKTYKPAIQLGGVGNRVAHCWIHDAPHQGIAYAGNEHVIEYCDFTRIAQETGDVGATYTMGDWTFLGHEFRYNYFHNIHGPGNLGCFTIYPDLPCGGIHLHGNIFYDVDQVFHSNSGRGMVVEDNIFLQCRKGFSFLPWRDAKMFQEGGPWRMVENLKAVNYDEPPYSTRYPLLQQLAKDFNKGPDHLLERELPKDNLIRHNISWGSRFLHVFTPGSLEYVQVQTNLIGDEIVFEGSFDGQGKSRTYRNDDPVLAAEFGKRGNILVQGDPGFGELQFAGFKFRRGSPAAGFGLTRIPFERIGLIVDEYRKTLPLTAYEPIIVADPGQSTNSLTARIMPTPRPRGPNIVIRYTVDGSEPNNASPVYSGPFTIPRATTVKAAAFVNPGGEQIRSLTATASFEEKR